MADKKDAVETILTLRKQLATAAAAKRSEEILKILKRLREEVVPSEDLIRTTKIGISVGKQRNNDDPEVAKLAKAMVVEWKRLMEPSKKDSTSKASLADSPAPAAASPTSSSNAATPVASTDRGRNASITIPPPAAGTNNVGGHRSVKTEGVTFDLHKDKTRDKCMELIFDSLIFDSQAPADLVFDRAKEVEQKVYRATGSDAGAGYRNKMRSLYLNLKDVKNPWLRENVVSGEISAEALSVMNPSDMASEERKAQDRKLQEANIFAARGAAPQQAETDAFRCGRCGKRKCTYYQMQTRSADEPMTTFVTCVNCNNRWKFS